MKKLFLHCATRFNDKTSFGAMKRCRLIQLQCGGFVGERGIGGLQQGLFAPLWQQYGPVMSEVIAEIIISALDVSPLPPFEHFCLLSVGSRSLNETGFAEILIEIGISEQEKKSFHRSISKESYGTLRG